MNLSEGRTLGGLLERIALVILITAISALLLLLAIMQDLQVPREILKYTLLAALGLAAGGSSRYLLANQRFTLKIFSALVALIVAMVALNVASRGFIGLDLLQQFPSGDPWAGALSFAISAAVAWLALRAWTRPRTILVEPRVAALPVPSPQAQHSARSSSRRPRQTVRPSPPSLINSFNTWRARTATQLAHLVPRRTTKVRGRKLSRATGRPKPNPRAPRRSRAVQLSAIVENRCPYCLEDVRKNDPRGVKICKVCKTWHHADCWAITGVCQVPHQYVH